MRRWIHPLVVVALLACSLFALAAAPPLQRPARTDARSDPLPGSAVARLGSARWRLRGEPAGLVVLPDGLALAVTVADRTIEVLSTQSGQRQFVLGIPDRRPGHSWTAPVALSRDGKRAAIITSAQGEAVISMRAGPTLIEERRLAYHRPEKDHPHLPAEAETAANRCGSREESVSALAFSPDGKVLAAAVRFYLRWKWWEGSQEPKFLEIEENTVGLWAVASGKRLRNLTAQRKEIKGILFSADGKTLITADREGTICFHDTSTGWEKRARVCVGRPLFCIAGSPDGRLLVAGSRECVLVWDTATGKLRHRLSVPAAVVGAVALSRDGKVLAGAGEGVIRLWDAASGVALRDAPPGARAATVFAFAADGSRLFSGHEGERVVRCWDVATLEPSVALEGPTLPVQAVAFTPDSKQVVLATTGGEFSAWDAYSGRPCDSRREDRQRLEKDGRAAVGRAWLSLCENGSDITPGLPPPRGTVVSCSADGTRVLAVRKRPNEKPTLVVRSRQDEILRTFPWEVSNTVSAALSPDGRRVVAAGGEVICFLDVTSGKVRRHAFPKPDQTFRPTLVKFAADGSRVVVVGDPATLRVVSVEGRLLAEIHETVWDFVGGLADLAFSPDGRTLAVGKYLGSVMVWEIATGQLVRHQRADRFLFSPDNRRVAVLERGTLRVHDIFSGEPLLQHREPNGYAGSFAFSPDGRLLAAACQDTTSLVWDLAALGKTARPRPLDDGSLEGLWKAVQVRGSGSAGVDDWRNKPGSLWKDLARGESARAYEAMARLLANPERSVPFLKKCLLVPPADADRVRRLIADMDSDMFATREAASGELTRLGRSAAPGLRDALAGKPSLELRLRARRLLGAIEGEEDSLSLAYTRGIQVLENIGTKDTREMLKILAGGGEGPHAAGEARAALRRLRAASTAGDHLQGRSADP